MKSKILHPKGFPHKAVYAFQGALGAYSQITVSRLSADYDAEVLPCQGFSDVFEAVSTGKADFGVLPVENALTGSIHDNFDLYLQYPDLEIIAEYRLRIQHNLIGLPGARIDEIEEVYSHIQGLLQCTQFLDAHTKMRKVPHFDTAGSVEFVRDSGDPKKAAIASALAAELYGMQILAPGIETNSLNYTRFAMVRSTKGRYAHLEWENREKASVVFGLSDRPGSLLEGLKTFASYGYNLKKIESRPIHGRPFEYMSYVDVDLGGDVEDMSTVCKILEAEHGFVRLLGIYPLAGDV